MRWRRDDVALTSQPRVPESQVAQRAISKRISGSGGSSGAFAGCITLMTEPELVGVSVTKYELFESEPTASCVAMPACDVRTRDKRPSRHSAMSAGARCEDTYTSGTDASRVGPEEPHAVRQAVTAVRATAEGASRRSLFMVRSSAFPALRGNVVRGCGGARAKRDAIRLDTDSASCFATRPSFICKRHASIAASEIAEISIPTAGARSHYRHRDGHIEPVTRMKKPAT
jgi:hypothetical protein